LVSQVKYAHLHRINLKIIKMNPLRNLVGRFALQPTLPESVSMSELSAKVYDSPGASISQASETLTHTPSISQLPMEIQLQIWSEFAMQEPDDGSRIFCLVPSTHRFAITLKDVNTLYTVTYQRRPLPVALQVCRISREAAKKEYVLLPTDVADKRGGRKMVYAHKTHDTLFFHNDINHHGLLKETFGIELSNLEDSAHVMSEATRLFFQLLSSFRHLAVDWKLWWAFSRVHYLPLRWSRVLPSLDEILIVLSIERTLRVPLFFRRITHGTVRSQSADLVMSMVEENIQTFRLEFSPQQPPRVRVVAFSDGNESSHGDEDFLAAMRDSMSRLPPNVSRS
jgi:2EXR family